MSYYPAISARFMRPALSDAETKPINSFSLFPSRLDRHSSHLQVCFHAPWLGDKRNRLPMGTSSASNSSICLAAVEHAPHPYVSTISSKVKNMKSGWPPRNLYLWVIPYHKQEYSTRAETGDHVLYILWTRVLPRRTLAASCTHP